MVSFFGDYDTTETVVIPFNTFTSDDPSASSTITNLASTDIHIHKDGGLTQRSSAAGVTVSIDFDSITGNHLVTIDLSDNTDAGFYANGSRYQVRMEGTTVDAATINAWIGAFSIGCTLRPTTAGRTLTVESDGMAHADVKEWLGTAPLALSSQQVQAVVPATQKVDVETIKTQAVTCAAGVTVGAYVGGTAAAALASVCTEARLAELDAANLPTDLDNLTLDVGNLNNVSNADVQADCDAALVARNLDHLCHVATVAADMTAEVVDNTILSRILANGDTSAFVPSTDGLQPIRDHIGDGTNLTEAGGTGDHLTAIPDAATLVTRLTAARAGYLDNLNGHTAQTGDNYARLGAPAGLSVSADVAAVKTDTGNLVTRIPAALFSGITSLAQWLGLMAGKQAGNATARTELRATGAGSGTFDETTDSEEALRDRGDAAWLTATGFSTHNAAAVKTAIEAAGSHLALIKAVTDLLPDAGALTTIGTDTARLTAARAAVLTDWIDGGRLDLILDIIAADVVNLDGAAMRGTEGAYTGTPPTANAIADQVWDEAIADHAGVGSTGEALSGASAPSAASVAAAVWAAVTRTLTANTNLNDPTSAAIAAQVRVELATELARIDQAISAAKTLTAAYDAAKTASQAGDAMALTAAERNSLSTALLDLASAIDGKTLRQTLRYIAATTAGLMPSGAGGGTETFKGLDESTDRVSFTVDANGNRTAVSYDP